MKIEQRISTSVVDYLRNNFQTDIQANQIQIQKTLENFDGDITIVVFPLVKITKTAPEELGHNLGDYLKNTFSEVVGCNIVKGFLNLSIDDSYYISFVQEVMNTKNFGFAEAPSGQKIMLEYSSPNTNKPLHLGHVRNNLLGYSIAEILLANGHNVIKTNLVNDRGIHICKTMLAWKKWGNNDSPEYVDQKGDHYVGKFYVLFEQNLKREMAELMATGLSEDEARAQSNLMQQAQELLRKWEDKDLETIQLWRKMNNWVYAGFEETYSRMGVSFDKIYHESDTYIKGKTLVEQGLSKGVFKRKENGSIWIDLTNEGLDEKLLLRADGTSVYITQDMGTAVWRHEEEKPDRMIYVVGNEQDYHFNVLKEVLKKMEYSWSDSIYHMSYGMVELPEGKMKSREGTVVDADDLMEEMVQTAKQITKELGKSDGLDFNSAQKLYEIIGMGALKYFMLKVDPKKNMMFNPEESVDFNGNTAPFIQYTYARIQSVIRKASEVNLNIGYRKVEFLNPEEKALIKVLYDYKDTVRLAGELLSPAIIANYSYDLAKQYNTFYHNCPIIKEDSEDRRMFRLSLSNEVAQVVKKSMRLLGVEMPNKM
ncbi:MAG: arginine--tRNA ligase [Bacteroidota bacterium]